MTPERIAIIGSTGQLGTDLVEVLSQDSSFNVYPMDRAECDCTNSEKVRQALRTCRPAIVINCAAYVRVDDSEDHPIEAFEVNSIGALHIARACAELDARCVYISTDYVFDGTKSTAYIESDPTCPINVYGTSKLAGEQMVRQSVAARWLIIRMASLFGKTGARGKGGNFIETMIAKARAGEPLGIVDDVRMSPTYTRDAAYGLRDLIEAKTEGIVHLTNEGACTWYEFAQQVLREARLSASIEPISSQAYRTRARRPKNSALGSERARQNLRPWQEALEAYLAEKGHTRPKI